MANPSYKLVRQVRSGKKPAEPTMTIESTNPNTPVKDDTERKPVEKAKNISPVPGASSESGNENRNNASSSDAGAANIYNKPDFGLSKT